jgi:hypothetical protein
LPGMQSLYNCSDAANAFDHVTLVDAGTSFVTGERWARATSALG